MPRYIGQPPSPVVSQNGVYIGHQSSAINVNLHWSFTWEISHSRPHRKKLLLTFCLSFLLLLLYSTRQKKSSLRFLPLWCLLCPSFSLHFKSRCPFSLPLKSFSHFSIDAFHPLFSLSTTSPHTDTTLHSQTFFGRGKLQSFLTLLP